MKLMLLTVGKISQRPMQQLVEDYAGRLGRYLPLEIVELKEEKGGGKKPDPRFIREKEGERVLTRIPDDAFVLLLDERGKGVGSEELASRLEAHMIDGTRTLCFVIGGAYGLSEPLKARADLLLSLSSMTLTHQMARMLLLEQLYRAMTIIRNEPYHNS